MVCMIHDGHVHTPYCPHGTADTFAAYCERAIQLGVKGITFTEHAPLPKNFPEPTPHKDSGMKADVLEKYINDITQLKKEYNGALRIFLGLEVDYIEGFEADTTAFLNEIGPYLDDAILSVHFLKIHNKYVCIDYSPDVFSEAVAMLGSVENVHKHYYNTVYSSVVANLGAYKPRRIGHMTLVRKFQQNFPTDYQFTNEITKILTVVKEKKYELDYNGAGYTKPLCKEPYPSEDIVSEAIRMQIPLVYGSDAHKAHALLSGFSQLVKNAPLVQPTQFQLQNR